MSSYLSRARIEEALGRGREVEQFLGGDASTRPRSIRSASMGMVRGRVVVALWVKEDVGSEERLDAAFFPRYYAPGEDREEIDDTEPAAEREFGADLDAALAWAASELGARPGRWLASGGVEREYLAWVGAGRPSAEPED